jgi:hypothetical protein
METSLSALQQDREQVVEEMRAIDRLRRGTLSQHFLRRNQNGKTITHGPYFVLQGYLRGQKFSRHIPAEQADQVAGDVANYQRFQALAERFITLSEQITERAENPDSKKNSSRRRSSTNASGRRKIS